MPYFHAPRLPSISNDHSKWIYIDAASHSERCTKPPSMMTILTRFSLSIMKGNLELMSGLLMIGYDAGWQKLKNSFWWQIPGVFRPGGFHLQIRQDPIPTRQRKLPKKGNRALIRFFEKKTIQECRVKVTCTVHIFHVIVLDSKFIVCRYVDQIQWNIPASEK